MENGAPDHLGPRLAAKPMHMFWLLDVSGSMSVDGKIGSLNDAMVEAIEAVQGAARENPGVQVKARVITFAHDAEWHAKDPVDIEDFEWSEVEAVERGTTELGLAIHLATEAIREVAAAGRGLPPALILVSDGKPTDLKTPSFGAALRGLADAPWGRKASRIAIGIGRDADMEALHHFIGHDEIKPIRASNAAELTHYLRWASTVVVDEKTRPAFGWESVRSEQDGPGTTEDATNDANEPGQPRDLPKAKPRDIPPPGNDKSRNEDVVDPPVVEDPQTDPDQTPTRPPQTQVEEPPAPPPPTTDPDEAATQPPKNQVEEPLTQPVPTTDPDETPTEPAPRAAPPSGSPRTDLPPPNGPTGTSRDGQPHSSAGVPTTDPAEEPTPPANAGTPTTPPPPQGVPRADLPPPPGLEPPPPPESSHDEEVVW